MTPEQEITDLRQKLEAAEAKLAEAQAEIASDNLALAAERVAHEQTRERLDRAYAWIANPDSNETSEEILAALRDEHEEPTDAR